MPITYHVPGLVITEREHSVPLDHATRTARRSPSSPASSPRPTAATGRTCCSSRAARASRRRARPARRRGWQKRALADYRVLLLDQRGTGRSTPVGRHPRRHAAGTGDVPDPLPRRLDRPRREPIRRELGVERWSVLGQSFGGFTSLTYLSFAPEGLREAMSHRRPSPVGRPVDDVYGATSAPHPREEPSLLRALSRTTAQRVADILRRLDRRGRPAAVAATG